VLLELERIEKLDKQPYPQSQQIQQYKLQSHKSQNALPKSTKVRKGSFLSGKNSRDGQSNSMERHSGLMVKGV
jgi:hypothetical protein